MREKHRAEGGRAGRLGRAALLLLALMLSGRQAVAGSELPGPVPAGTGAPSAAARAGGLLRTEAGHAFTPPEGYEMTREGPKTVFTPPEPEGQLTLVDLETPDADEAIAGAWLIARPAFARELRLVSPQPVRDGWEDIVVADYETGPTERRTIRAIGFRRDRHWAVLLMYGAEAAYERRGPAIEALLASLRPRPDGRENFAGLAPRPLDAAAVEAMQAFLRRGMRDLGIPGLAFSLIDRGRVVFEGGLGVRELGKPEPVDAHTLFMAASNTKAMTTALLAGAVDAGRLRWDQAVTDAYRPFRLGDPDLARRLQVRHLACACTGLPRRDMDWVFGDGRPSAAATFERLAQMKPAAPFGDAFLYSNHLVSAAGFIGAAALEPGVEPAQAYERQMRKRLFEPLGMEETTFDFDRALRGNHASPHAVDLDGTTRLVRQDLNRKISALGPSGAVWTNAHDLSRFVMMELAGGRNERGEVVISRSNLLERYQPQVEVAEGITHGMGLFVDRQLGIPVVRHGGDLLGYRSDMIWLPEHGVGATILTNADAGEALRGLFARALIELLFDGRPDAVRLLSEAAAARRAAAAERRAGLERPVSEDVGRALAPRYLSPELGWLTVRREAGTLQFAFRGGHSEMALRRLADGSLSFVAVDPGMGGIELLLAAEGKDADKARGECVLLLRDGQHEYRFVPQPPRSAAHRRRAVEAARPTASAASLPPPPRAW